MWFNRRKQGVVRRRAFALFGFALHASRVRIQRSGTFDIAVNTMFQVHSNGSVGYKILSLWQLL